MTSKNYKHYDIFSPYSLLSHIRSYNKIIHKTFNFFEGHVGSD